MAVREQDEYALRGNRFLGRFLDLGVLVMGVSMVLLMCLGYTWFWNRSVEGPT